MISTSSQPVRIKSIKGLLIGCIIIQSSIQGLIQLSFAQEVNLSDITTQEGVQGATNTPEENTNQAMEVISEDNLSTESSTMTDTISNIDNISDANNTDNNSIPLSNTYSDQQDPPIEQSNEVVQSGELGGTDSGLIDYTISTDYIAGSGNNLYSEIVDSGTQHQTIEDTTHQTHTNITGDIVTGDILTGDVGTGIQHLEGRTDNEINNMTLEHINQLSPQRKGYQEDNIDIKHPEGSLVVNKLGQIDQKSINSYNAQGTNDQTYCSLITRLNIERITGLGSQAGIAIGNTISQGHALDLIKQGLEQELFEVIPYHKKEHMLLYLATEGKTVYDVYSYHHTMNSENELNKGHRFTVFQGTDTNRYVLDPILGGNTNPIPLSDYIISDPYESTYYILKKGYNATYHSSLIIDKEDIDILVAGERLKVVNQESPIYVYKVKQGGKAGLLKSMFIEKFGGSNTVSVATLEGDSIGDDDELYKDMLYIVGSNEKELFIISQDIRELYSHSYMHIHNKDDLWEALKNDSNTINNQSIKKDFEVFIDQGKIVVKLLDKQIEDYANGDQIDPKDAQGVILESIVTKSDIADTIQDKLETTQLPLGESQIDTIIEEIGTSIIKEKQEEGVNGGVQIHIQGNNKSLIFDQEDIDFQAGSLEIVLSPEQLDPGNYSVQFSVTNPFTNETYTVSQTIDRGVVAINTNKDTYKPGDTVQLEIGAIDEQGHPTCNAQIQGYITAPNGNTTYLTIDKNTDCGILEEGYIIPDYQSLFTIDQEGDYFVSITVTTDQGSYTQTQRIKSIVDTPLVVTRTSATRNFPYGKTPMNISIFFNHDFQGTVTEFMPGDFDLYTISNGGTEGTQQQRKTITWNVSATAGETLQLTYLYDAPNISPEFYIIGPLQFNSSLGDIGYTEKRIRQIANDEYTQNNNIGEFTLTTLTNFIGMDLSNTVNVIGDIGAGVIRLNNTATTGYFQTIDITPSSLYGRKALTWSGNGNPSSLEIRDCSNNILATISSPTSPVSLSGINALSGVTCMRVRMYLVGNSSSPQFSQIKVTWDPKPILSMNISGPSPISAGSCSDYTISWQNSFVDDTGVVLFVQLPSRASGTVYNYTTGYGQYSGGNYYDPYFPGGFYGVGAPYFNPLGLPISFSGRYTAVATSVNNVTIPANSIYWNLGSVTAGTTANYRFLLCTRIGTQTGTMFSLSGLIDGQLSETGFDDYAARIASIPGRTSNTTLSNTYSCDGLVKLAPDASSKTVNYSHYVQNRNGGSQTESIFNPFIDFDFTDIINDLQSACGVGGYTGAISRFSFTTTGGSWSGSTYTFPTSSFQTGWLIPGAVKYFYFAVDYTGCNTSGSAFTYTGTRDGDNIAPLSIARTVTIGECIVQTGVFNKFPISVTLPYSYGQSIPYTLQFNNANGDRKGMMILYDKIPTETYLGGSGSIVGAPGYIYYSTTGAGNLWSNPPAWNTGTMFSGDAGPNWTTGYTSGAVWIMAAIPHMNSNLFPITTGPYVGLSTFSNLNFNAVIKSTGACSLFVRNTGAYEIRQRTLSPDSFDTGLINLTTPVIGSAFDNLPAVPDEIRPIIQNVPPNNWFNPLYTLNYSVTDFLGMGTYMQTGQFMMTGLDGSFTGSLTIPLPLLNINGVSMYPSLNAVTLLRNNVPYTNYTVIPVTSGATPGNSAIVLSFTGLQTGNYQYGIKIDIPHGFFQGGTTTILLTGVNTCAPYSGKSQLTINPIQGSQILQAFKYNETPISAPNGIIQYNMNTQSLGKRYTTNTLIIDKVPTNTTFIDAQTSGITTNLQTFNCPGCRVYFYSGASIPVTPTSGFIYANFVTGINTLGVRTPPFPASQVTYVAYKIDNPNTIPPNVFPVGTGNRVGMRVQVSSGATDGLVISNEYKVISDQLLPTNSNKVETIVSTINLRDLILTKSGQSVGLDGIIGTTDDQTGSALVGKEVRYTINYISNSSSGASDAHIIDPIPANTCFKVGSLTNVFPPISHTFAYSNNGGSTYTYTPVGIYDCSVTHIRINFTQPINPGRIGKFQFDVIINNGFTGTGITNNATIFWSGTEMNMANNTGTSFLPLYRSDLYINKSVNKPITYSLDSLVYTLDYGNNGPNITTSVVITDTLPTGFIYTSSTPSGIVSGNQIIFTTGSLNVGQTGRVTINGTISGGLVSGYVLNNTVSITSLSNDSNTGNNTSSGTTIIRDRLSDVLIVKTPSILTGLTGASLNYTLQYRNLGPDTAPNVVIVDTLPTGFVYASSSPSGVLSGGKVTRGTSQIAGLTNLATGSTGTITIFGSISGGAQSGDLLTNVVTIDTSSEINTGNNISTGITLVRARMVDLVISKAVNLTGAYTGNSLTYTIQYRNLGPDNGNNVIITDTLPTGFVYTSSSPSGVLSGNIVTWTSGQIGVFGNYAPGASGTITINGTISGLAQSGDILFNEVVITNAILESNPNNNSGSASTLVKNRFADLVVIKTPSLLTGYAGSGLTYTIQYRNLGPDLGLNTVITDTLPTGFVYTSSSPSGVLSGRTITWTSGQIAGLANLVTGSTGTITIVGSISGTFNGNQQLHNTVSISGAYIDPNTGNNQGTGSTFVNPKADIRVTKAVSTGILFSGDYVSYTLSYYNSGLDTGTNITITDTWPSGLLFISASTGYNFVPTNKYVFTIPVLPVGVTGTITLTGLVLGGTSGTKIGNHVLITGNELDPLTGNNGTGVTGTIIDKYFDLELDKNLLNTGTVYVGQQVGYTITVLNKGPFTGYNITVADLLPIGISYFIHSLTQGTYDQALGIWTIGTLGYLQSATLTLTGTLMTGGVITNYAQIIGYSGGVDIDSTGGNNSGTGSNPDEDDDDKVPVTGTRPADVSITKTANQWSGHTGEIITFVLTYMNTGTGSASNVQLIDTLPTGLTYYSAFPTPLVSGSTVTRTSGQVPALGNLGPGASGFVWVNVLIASGALSGSWWTNTGRITTTSLETNTGNNVGTATVLVNQWITDLEITKTPSIQTGYAGDSVSYTIWYHNNGPDRGINTVITDILPQGFIYDYSVPAGVLSGNILTWASGEIPMFHEKFFQGDSGYITIYGSIDPSYPGNQWLHNTVSITSNIPESNTGNNQATGSVWVLPVADLVIDKSQSSDIVYSGEYILYTLSYKNGGKDTGTNVIITDHRPHNEIQFISASLPYTFSGPNYYSFVIPSIAPGEGGEIFITGLVLGVASGTQATNYAIISGNELDPDRGNNETKITTTIMTPYFDLELDKNLINSGSIYLGQNVGYTITVINQGPFTGYNITVSELLPLGINYFSHLTTQGLYDPSQGIWFIGTLGVMQTVTLTLTGTSTAAGTFVNYAQISGYNGGIDNDSTGGNNSGTGSNPDEDDDDTVSVTILNPVNLKITKDIITSPGILGKTVTWTLSYVNEGPGNATDVTITDIIPAGLSYSGSSIIGTAVALSLSGDVTYVFALGTIASGATGIITLWTTITSGYNTSYTNRASITTTALDTNSGDNSDDAVVPVISTFLGLVDPYACNSAIYGRITNTGNGVHYVTIRLLTSTGAIYKVFNPTLDTTNNFSVLIDYTNTSAINYVASGIYTIQYELKELSGKLITGSYDAFITSICPPGGGGGGPIPHCGDGIVQATIGEQCEPGQQLPNGMQCTAQCKLTGAQNYCGDGIVDTSRGEACEPSTFSMTGKSCNNQCQIIANPSEPFCGDGILQINRGEQCEVGMNLTGGWTCNASCKQVRVITNPEDPVLHHVAEHTIITGTQSNTSNTVLILPKTGADR